MAGYPQIHDADSRILLDAQEEDLVPREAALTAMLCTKDEDVEKFVAQQTQELKQEHKEALDALALDHAGKLKEAIDGAEAAEAAKVELAGKVEKLELELEELK